MISCVIALSICAFLNASSAFAFDEAMVSSKERYYIDEEEYSTKGNAFYIHTGGNVWIMTNSLHRDKTGLFTYTCDIIREGQKNLEERRWGCPYCHEYWPMGQKCDNKDCPSLFPRKTG